MTTTRYAIRHQTNGHYVHDLAPYTMPSATTDPTKAKTWSTRASAQRNLVKYGLTSSEVVVMPETEAAPEFPHHVHTAQDNEAQAALVTYRAKDGHLHTERVTNYLAGVLRTAGLLEAQPNPEAE